ncbi:SRPBCC domain-containing protein [Acholeplasma equirhinis]|uniref:SRPBCC domain-containing protein n=1 Tax=Acholeplasma equirhinis TaxID=555393 RepID=UPI00197AE597|nr:SRPBCC domain-containing protein [Acholeplasma equirhinis]MBN3490967.1 SRPBCC domain-containing protein [Acholeplasma equirhinis]
MKITVTAMIDKPVEFVYQTYNDPKQVKFWNHASDDWHSPSARADFKVGGRFSYRMEAKDGTDGFDFEGTYRVITKEHINYIMDDNREVDIYFHGHGHHTHLDVIFDAENTYPAEFQKAGWQAILDNFKAYCESLK